MCLYVRLRPSVDVCLYVCIDVRIGVCGVCVCVYEMGIWQEMVRWSLNLQVYVYVLAEARSRREGNARGHSTSWGCLGDRYSFRPGVDNKVLGNLHNHITD